jgi:hypothetical protein
MTPKEIEKFRSDFKSIVYLKSELIKSNNIIRNLSRYDKNGSHQKAILKAIDIRSDIKLKYNKKLDGKTYEEWFAKSKRITTIQRMIKTSIRTKDKWVSELNNLKP